MLIGGYFKNTDLFNIRNETISENPPKVIECNKVSNEVREDDIEYDVDISEFNEFF